MRRNLIVLSVLLFVGTCLCWISVKAEPQNSESAGSRTVRTVSKSEIGMIFAYPNGFSWKDVGAYVGMPVSAYYAQMSPEALKIQHGRFQFFGLSDDHKYSLFPYSRLKEFENGQPIFITATYQQKKRPVYFNWSLKLRNGVPTTSPEEWQQAVDVSSDRFINFWINDYVKNVLWRSQAAPPNHWVGIDDCAFTWDLYGVLDDEGRYVTNVPWDAPWPQNSDEYLDSIKQFFHKLHTIAPEIKVMCNVGALKDPKQFPSIYADVPGIMTEDIAYAAPPAYARKKKYDLLTSVSWFTSVGRVAVLRGIPANATEDIRTAYVTYLLLKGANSFFAPQFKGTTTAVPPDQYRKTCPPLGEPTEVMRLQSDRDPSYTLYSRTYEHGIVYLNWTGRSQNIALPNGQAYSDADGRPISSITVPDMTGTCVAFAH
jgi:hypothetical protein